jgi:dTDP-4-dehydrorhamnose 3,5-epimerase
MANPSQPAVSATRPALEAAAADQQTVTASGQRTLELIDGVRVREAVTQIDERGTLCEIYDPAWGFSDAPLVYVYQTTVRPQTAKGWVAHEHQDDRLFVSAGTLKLVLYDDRADSPTYGRLNELFLSGERRGIVGIPRRVFHAVANVGTDDALFINMPTAPYRHEQPDKRRLPLDTPLIPYSFEGFRGG